MRLEIMKDASEDEQEEDFMDRAEANPIKGRKAKSERTEQLRKMMDDEGKTAAQSSLKEG